VAIDAATPTDRKLPRLPGRRVLVYMLGVLVITFVPAIVIPNFVCREDHELQDLGSVPAFSLVDQDGQVFTDEALRGHPTIVNFIFTRCDTICPITSMKMARLEEKTRDKRGAAIKLLSITVDPEHDTPDKLAAFAERYKANPERWRFVTGKPADIRQVEKVHREAVKAASETVRRLLTESGDAATPATMVAVTETLEALPTSEQPGRLVRPLKPQGFAALAGFAGLAVRPVSQLRPVKSRESPSGLT